jgi:hypothetical protein
MALQRLREPDLAHRSKRGVNKTLPASAQRPRPWLERLLSPIMLHRDPPPSREVTNKWAQQPNLATTRLKRRPSKLGFKLILSWRATARQRPNSTRLCYPPKTWVKVHTASPGHHGDSYPVIRNHRPSPRHPCACPLTF